MFKIKSEHWVEFIVIKNQNLTKHKYEMTLIKVRKGYF